MALGSPRRCRRRRANRRERGRKLPDSLRRRHRLRLHRAIGDAEVRIRRFARCAGLHQCRVFVRDGSRPVHGHADAPPPRHGILCQGRSRDQRRGAWRRRVGCRLHSDGIRCGGWRRPRPVADLLHVGPHGLDKGHLVSSRRDRLAQLHRRQPHSAPRAHPDWRVHDEIPGVHFGTLGRPGLLARQRRPVGIRWLHLAYHLQDIHVPRHGRRRRQNRDHRFGNRCGDRPHQRHHL